MLDHLKDSGKTKLSIPKLDKLMQNIGKGQFNYEVFNSAYDADPKIQNLVTNFDQNKIELKGNESDDLPAAEPDTDNTVSGMAQQATDLGDEL